MKPARQSVTVSFHYYPDPDRPRYEMTFCQPRVHMLFGPHARRVYSICNHVTALAAPQ